jgi:hypothetical protein
MEKNILVISGVNAPLEYKDYYTTDQYKALLNTNLKSQYGGDLNVIYIDIDDPLNIKLNEKNVRFRFSEAYLNKIKNQCSKGVEIIFFLALHGERQCLEMGLPLNEGRVNVSEIANFIDSISYAICVDYRIHSISCFFGSERKTSGFLDKIIPNQYPSFESLKKGHSTASSLINELKTEPKEIVGAITEAYTNKRTLQTSMQTYFVATKSSNPTLSAALVAKQVGTFKSFNLF